MGYVLIAIVGAVILLAVVNKPSSVYRFLPEEKNRFEGKRVVFIENSDEPQNSDGMCGHLEPIGETIHKSTLYERIIKRIIDIILSFTGLVMLSPLFLIISIIIFIDDPGPILFSQKRVGKDKRFFKLHKFRSMKTSTPHNMPTHMLDDSERYITRIGKFMRNHSLDELPQIWDIFIGNMSVIGPRPALYNQDWLIACRDKYEANDIKPGLTGWAQINGRDELEIPEKAKLDGEYREKMSFAFDTKCFIRSLRVFGGDKNIVEGSIGRDERNAKR